MLQIAPTAEPLPRSSAQKSSPWLPNSLRFVLIYMCTSLQCISLCILLNSQPAWAISCKGLLEHARPSANTKDYFKQLYRTKGLRLLFKDAPPRKEPYSKADFYPLLPEEYFAKSTLRRAFRWPQRGLSWASGQGGYRIFTPLKGMRAHTIERPLSYLSDRLIGKKKTLTLPVILLGEATLFYYLITPSAPLPMPQNSLCQEQPEICSSLMQLAEEDFRYKNHIAMYFEFNEHASLEPDSPTASQKLQLAQHYAQAWTQLTQLMKEPKAARAMGAQEMLDFFKTSPLLGRYMAFFINAGITDAKHRVHKAHEEVAIKVLGIFLHEHLLYQQLDALFLKPLIALQNTRAQIASGLIDQKKALILSAPRLSQEAFDKLMHELNKQIAPDKKITRHIEAIFKNNTDLSLELELFLKQPTSKRALRLYLSKNLRGLKELKFLLQQLVFYESIFSAVSECNSQHVAARRMGTAQELSCPSAPISLEQQQNVILDTFKGTLHE